MNPMNDMHPLVANSLQTSIAVAVLFALVLLVRKPFARNFGAKAAYALWLVPLARLFMPPLPSNFSLFGVLAPLRDAEPAAAAAPAQMVVVRAHGAEAAALPAVPPPAQFAEFHVTADVASTDPSVFAGLLSALPSMIVPLWLIGVTLMLGIAWRRQAVFHQLIRDDSAPASDTVTDMAQEIAAQLKVRRPFDVRTSLLNGSPLVTGLTRPVILLPEWFEADYTPREQRDALTHELTHVKRGDLFALQLAQIVLALQWFNPLAYWAIRAFRVDQEAACDADVLRAGTSSAFSYGRTLVKAARLAGPADCAFSGANLTLAHPIKERLILMQNTAPTFRRRLLGTTLAVTLGSAAVLTTASCAASAAPLDQSSTELAGGDERAERHAERLEDRNHRVYSFSSHHGDDKVQIVLLSDPFEELQPRLQELHKLDLSDLEDEMQRLSIEISKVAELEELEGLVELEALESMDLSGLAELENLKFDFDLAFSGLDGMDIETIETEDGIRIIIPNQEIFISKLDGDHFELQIERAAAIAEAHADRAEALAEVHAERAERMAEAIERRVEIHADRMEAVGEEMEARIEAAFEDGLEDDLEAAGEVVESLADRCQDRDEDIASPEIVSVRENGKTYRALCVNGTRSRLQDADVKDYVMSNPSLSDAEKERFTQQRTTTFEYSWSED